MQESPLCDGCSVLSPWEHRCCAPHQPCVCLECHDDRVIETAGSPGAHPCGCVCEDCSAAYERERWDPRG